MRKQGYFFILALVLALGMIWGYFNLAVRFNNTVDKDQQITVVYPSDKTDAFIKKFNTERYEKSFSVWTLPFKKQCVRKTKAGGYVLLKENTGKEIYLFFDKKRKIYEILRVDGFQERDAFDFIRPKETSINELTDNMDGKIRLYFASRQAVFIFLRDEIMEVLFDNEESAAGNTTAQSVQYLAFKDGEGTRCFYILPIDRHATE